MYSCTNFAFHQLKMKYSHWQRWKCSNLKTNTKNLLLYKGSWLFHRALSFFFWSFIHPPYFIPKKWRSGEIWHYTVFDLNSIYCRLFPFLSGRQDLLCAQNLLMCIFARFSDEVGSLRRNCQWRNEFLRADWRRGHIWLSPCLGA